MEENDGFQHQYGQGSSRGVCLNFSMGSGTSRSSSSSESSLIEEHSSEADSFDSFVLGVCERS